MSDRRVCYHCGRKGARGYISRMDGWQCANEKACRTRQDDISPASLFRQIEALIDREEYQQGNADYLGHRIRKILNRQRSPNPFGKREKSRQCSECGSYFTGQHFCWGSYPT